MAMQYLGEANVKECYTAPKTPEPKLSVPAVEKMAKKLKVDSDLVFDYGETFVKADYKYVI
jgi:hypothetical protein